MIIKRNQITRNQINKKVSIIYIIYKALNQCSLALIDNTEYEY